MDIAATPLPRQSALSKRAEGTENLLVPGSENLSVETSRGFGKTVHRPILSITQLQL
jgi:hypothetical protein